MLKQLEAFVSVHSHFARWERVKHRALTIIKIGFPETHPLQHAIDSICQDVEEGRRIAERILTEFIQKHGPFRGVINGFVFDSPTELFQSSLEKYWDCPEYTISNECQRTKRLNLTSVACLHILEPTGKNFLASVGNLLDVPPASTKRKLEKDCERMQRHLKRIKICPRQKLGVLLCLQHVGFPRETSSAILQFLVWTHACATTTSVRTFLRCAYF